jgi:hypothetical protein
MGPIQDAQTSWFKIVSEDSTLMKTDDNLQKLQP